MSERQRVVIVGGGFTGASVAYHLARALGPEPRAEIVVVEPRATLGQGLAYSTADPSHRINVPASRITMDTAIEDGFQRWIEENGVPLSDGTRMADGSIYPQRGLVADYIADQLRPYLQSGAVRHIRARALAVEKREGFRVTLDNGAAVTGGRLVIATSHPPPSVPAAFAGLIGSPHLVADPSDAARITKLARSGGDIAVIGTGLTSADVIASLARQGFAGRILAMSRRGLRSRGHAAGYGESPADFATNPEVTALAVLRRIRRAVREDAARGLPWQAALDRVRKQGGAIWQALPQTERAKLVRRLRVWWDVHRFRIAPPVEAALDALVAEGRLTFAAGHLIGAAPAPQGIALDWRPKGQSPRRETFAAVVLTTGPAHQSVLESSDFLTSLGQQGLIRPDALALGLDVARGCLALGAEGSADGALYVAGPLARAHIGELMGIPEVTAHAELVARELAHALAEKPQWIPKDALPV